MNVNKIFISMLVAFLVLAAGVASAQEMTKDQWQQEITKYTQMRADVSAKVKDLSAKIATLQGQSTKADADYQKCIDELYALVGADAAKAAAYRAEVEAAEAKANDLIRLSDADLAARSTDVDALEAQVKALWDNKLSLLPEFYDRVTALSEKVKSLRNTLAAQVKTYTVGTWAKNRDCLWNISKKKDIYNNAWMWPKIWQGNREQIKDPDVIKKGQKLRIPKAGELNAEEKSAAKKYYAKKAAK